MDRGAADDACRRRLGGDHSGRPRLRKDRCRRGCHPRGPDPHPHFRMDSLAITVADLDLDGASHPRYPPLRDAIARRYDVSIEQVVAADGTSMANFLAMAAMISPGDEVLVERPTYEPLIGAASFLGASIKRFERKAADDFRLDPPASRTPCRSHSPRRRHQPAQPEQRACKRGRAKCCRRSCGKGQRARAGR